jgi:hypothetical protein
MKYMVDTGLSYRALGCGAIACAAKVAECPESRPETRNVRGAWEGDASLDEATCETELVPARYHATYEPAMDVSFGIFDRDQ